MQVSPSVVVDIVDELERRAALRRIRDQVDRRRQMVEPTDAGVSLANECLRISQQLDRELLAPFNDEAGRADLRRPFDTPQGAQRSAAGAARPLRADLPAELAQRMASSGM